MPERFCKRKCFVEWRTRLLIWELLGRRFPVALLNIAVFHFRMNYTAVSFASRIFSSEINHGEIVDSYVPLERIVGFRAYFCKNGKNF